MKQIITTSAAPAAIGTYSQAVAAGNHVYLSGQIGLDPQSMELVADNLELQLHQVFRNLAAVCAAAGGSLADLLKLNVYLLDMADFATVNQIMAEHVPEPFPARAALAVSGLPKGARVEIDGVMLIPQQRGD